MDRVEGIPKLWREEEMEALTQVGMRERPSSLDSEDDK
jgi:hypothetical protein